MALQLPDFPYLTNEQAFPFGAGLKQGSDLAQSILQSYFYPQKAKADIAKSQADTASAQANTNKLNKETEFIPLKNLVEASNAQRQNSRFGQAYQLHSALNSMDASSRNLWISQHPDDYNQMLTTFAQQSNIQKSDPLQAAIQKYFPQFMNNSQQNNSSISQLGQEHQPQNNIPTLNSGQQAQSNQPTDIPNEQPKLLDDTEKLKNSLEHQSNRKAVTTQMNARADAAVGFESWLGTNKDKYNQSLKTINKYSGRIGNAKKWLDANSYETPEDYENVKWFETSFIPNLANQVKMMEKLSSSDTQREELHSLADALTSKDLDPKSAVKVFNRQISTLQDVSDSIISAAEPNVKGTYRKQFGLKRLTGGYIKRDVRDLSDDELRKIANG
jgi:hypothetical protein